MTLYIWCDLLTDTGELIDIYDDSKGREFEIPSEDYAKYFNAQDEMIYNGLVSKRELNFMTVQLRNGTACIRTRSFNSDSEHCLWSLKRNEEKPP